MENLCYHSHNFLCDGHNPMEDYIQSAINQNVIHYGFSSHSPLNFANKWSILSENLNLYVSEIYRLREKYKNKLQIFKSLEYDYAPGFSKDADFYHKLLKLDYLIASVHLVLNKQKNELWFIDGPREGYLDGINRVFDGDVKRAVLTFFDQTIEMVYNVKPDIIGHFDKIVMNNQEEFFSSEDEWFLNKARQALEVIRKNGCIIEVNTRGLYRGKWKYTFPSPDLLKICFQQNIPVVISSDVHSPEEICMEYASTRELLLKTGYKYQMKRYENQWVKSYL